MSSVKKDSSCDDSTDIISKPSDSAVAISVNNLIKTYRLYNSPLDRLKESIHPFRKKYHQEFNALNGVSFEIKKGESVGIIGKNGSGKSTLLKVITSVLTPTSGTVQVNGKVSALLELGAGFNAELTGIENIYFNGMLMGYTREEMDVRLNDILSFADIGEFIYQPVKTYSSGMFVRLAFAVGTNVEPEILIIDEALSVGDVYFQQKCMRKISQFKDAGGSIIFVSHDMNAVRIICDVALLLDKGQIREQGNPKIVSDVYQGSFIEDSHYGITPVEIERFGANSVQIGTGEAELISCVLFDEADVETRQIVSGEILKIRFNVIVKRYFEDPHYGFFIRNRHGQSIFDTNSYCMKIRNQAVDCNDTIEVTYTVKCPLVAGEYTISFGVSNQGYGGGSFEEYILLVHDINSFTVLQNPDDILFAGVVNLFPELTVINKKIGTD